VDVPNTNGLVVAGADENVALPTPNDAAHGPLMAADPGARFAGDAVEQGHDAVAARGRQELAIGRKSDRPYPAAIGRLQKNELTWLNIPQSNPVGRPRVGVFPARQPLAVGRKRDAVEPSRIAGAGRLFVFYLETVLFLAGVRVPKPEGAIVSGR